MVYVIQSETREVKIDSTLVLQGLIIILILAIYSLVMYLFLLDEWMIDWSTFQ